MPPGGQDFVRYKFCGALGLTPGGACKAFEFVVTKCGAAASVLVTQAATVWINWAHGQDDFEEGLRLLEGDLRSLKGQAAASGARLAIVLHPNWSDWRWRRWYPHAFARVSGLLAAEAIPYLDLGETAVRPGSGPRLTIRLDGHWNETGHAVVAEAIARFLSEERLLPSR